ncbi:MAG TPA: lysylphosphatidylglycerol synthase transmembrane domain-containing protein [Polyangia bacterium]|nr:lysylphosphatidylglycerol synthase transmembrane domain-containing protein [Polyangia bacterium]
MNTHARVVKILTHWLVPAAVFAALAWLIVHKIDAHEFTRALRLADWRLVVGAGILAGTLCMGGLILRLFTLLSALPHDAPVGLMELASIHFASSAAHNLLPAPAGEVLRTVQLKRRHGYSVGVLVAAQLIEKVVEALGLGIGTLVVASLGGLPRGLGASMYAFAALGAGGAAVALVVGWRWTLVDAPYASADGLPFAAATRVHVGNFFRRLGEGMHQLRSPSVWARALGWSMMSDAANALTVGLCLMAVGVTLPLAAWFLVMLVARAAGIVPSTPGQFGVQEAGVVVALGFLGVDHNRALAVALLHHMAHFVPVTLVGLVELRRQWVPRTVTP